MTQRKAQILLTIIFYRLDTFLSQVLMYLKALSTFLKHINDIILKMLHNITMFVGIFYRMVHTQLRLVYCCFSEAEWKPSCDWSTAWFWSIHESCHWWSCWRVQDWWKEPHWHGGMWFSFSAFCSSFKDSSATSTAFLAVTGYINLEPTVVMIWLMLWVMCLYMLDLCWFIARSLHRSDQVVFWYIGYHSTEDSYFLLDLDPDMPGKGSHAPGMNFTGTACIQIPN